MNNAEKPAAHENGLKKARDEWDRLFNK
jgi:hypothetical protein